MNDEINFFKAVSHKAELAPITCHSNETHHQDFKNDVTSSSKIRDAACGKMIQELWLSRCQDAMNEEHDKLVQANHSLRTARSDWHKAA
jgi:hypothetical protein